MREFSERKPNRLRGYDYSKNGAYFLTICVKDRTEILGKVERGQIILDEYGIVVAKEMASSCELRKECKIEQCVIMPNHIHLILLIQHPVGADGNRPISPNRPTAPKTPQNHSVPSFVRGLKGSVSRILGFSIWQHSFHDHIIRDENEYARLAHYIENNPANWESDCFHPSNWAALK